MNDLVKLAQDAVETKRIQIEGNLALQFKQAIQDLRTSGEETKRQLETLANLKAPVDMLKLYLETGGKVWVSKLRLAEQSSRIGFQVGSYQLEYLSDLPRPDKRQLCRYIIIMVPQPTIPDKQGYVRDEYGDQWKIE